MQMLHSIQCSPGPVEARLSEPVSIGELAVFAGMSLWHFQRTFSALVGEPMGRS
jgi:AraC-like DNA-binding protein